MNAYFFTKGFEAFIVNVAPDLLHIIPVCDDSMLERVSDLEQPSQLRRRLLPNKDLALQCSSQYAEVLWPPYKGGEVAFWYVVSSEAGSNGAGPIVEHNGRVVERVCHGASKVWVCRRDVELDWPDTSGGKVLGKPVVGC